MKKVYSSLILAAAVLATVDGRSQLTNINTNLAAVEIGSGWYTAVQTFTGFSALTDVSWTVKNTSGSSQTATFSTFLAEWNTTTNSAEAGTFATFGTTSLSSGAIASGYTKALEFSAALPPLDPSLTYALMLTYTGGDVGFSALTGSNPGGAFFGSGGLAVGVTSFATAGPAGFENHFATNSFTVNQAAAWTMSVSGTPSAVPEPKTAAAAFAVLFVAGLVGRRKWQQRKISVPLAA
jgi:hypothetical protein